MEHPQEMNWHDVAMVGFENGNPVIITSVEPRVLLGTLLSQYRFQDDDGEEDFDYRFKMLDTDFDEIEQNILEGSGIEWKLYPVEVAKEIFCSHKRKRGGDEAPPSPLPGQLTLPME